MILNTYNQQSFLFLIDIHPNTIDYISIFTFILNASIYIDCLLYLYLLFLVYFVLFITYGAVLQEFYLYFVIDRG